MIDAWNLFGCGLVACCGCVACTVAPSRSADVLYPLDESLPRENRGIREMLHEKADSVSSEYGFLLFTGTKEPLDISLVDVTRQVSGRGTGRERVLSGELKVTYEWKYGFLKLPFLPPLLSWTGAEHTSMEPFRLKVAYQADEGREVPFSEKLDARIRAAVARD